MNKWLWDWEPSKFQQMRLDKDKTPDHVYRPEQMLAAQEAQLNYQQQQQFRATNRNSLSGLALGGLGLGLFGRLK